MVRRVQLLLRTEIISRRPSVPPTETPISAGAKSGPSARRVRARAGLRSRGVLGRERRTGPARRCVRHGLSQRAGVSRRPGTCPVATGRVRIAHQRPPFSRITGGPATREIASDRVAVIAQHDLAPPRLARTPPAERPPAAGNQHQRTRQGDVSAGHAGCKQEHPARPSDTSGTVLIPGMSAGRNEESIKYVAFT